MVCVGNICRSPVAERLLAARAAEAGLALTVASAGVDALIGSPIDALAAAELVRLGGSPEGFTAQQLTPALVAEADLVLAATKGVRARVLGFDPTAMRRTFTINELAALAPLVDVEPGSTPAERIALAARLRSRVAKQDLDLRDPYRLEASAHRDVADQIAASVDAVLGLLH